MPLKTVVIPWFDANDLQGLFLPMFVLYFNPKDFPDKYVVRMFDVDRPTSFVTVRDTEETAIGTIPRPNRARLERSPGDDPKIVAVFL